MQCYRPELQATAKDIDEVKQLAEAGADAIYIGDAQFGNRLAGHFSIEEIKTATAYLHERNKRAYIMINTIFHNNHIDALTSFLTELKTIKVDGIVAGDPSIFQIISDLAFDIPLNWHPATLSTNYQTLNFWHKRGLRRATLANELALSAVVEIKEQVGFPIDIQVHGMSCIFQSKRSLVTNYYNHIELDYHQSKTRYIKEAKKAETHYPIFEDQNGTHIMSNEDIVMVDYLAEILDAQIDGLKIEGMLKSTAYNAQIVAIYRDAIDTYLADPEQYKMKKLGWKQAIYAIQPNQRKIGTGFYFKEQIY
ncbi:putative protease [Amphibacillus marinus]|uniref:Putative protease n=1 Tax=Amphibacillus marinus TaxID=872970 RepID=A0A1H8GNF3_9BACI|nr:peptidase U32 family protein [Amphibacillus marinus]SEN45264.1 putative protease [Amphibacillus marinus]